MNKIQNFQKKKHYFQESIFIKLFKNIKKFQVFQKNSKETTFINLFNNHIFFKCFKPSWIKNIQEILKIQGFRKNRNFQKKTFLKYSIYIKLFKNNNIFKICQFLKQKYSRNFNNLSFKKKRFSNESIFIKLFKNINII